MAERKINIALTWWATWWHIFPLLSTYNYLKENKNLNFYWFWEEEWLEFDIAMENDIKFIDLPAWKLRRYFDWRNFFEPLKNITWIFFWLYYLIRYRIDIVFSKWGYVAVPLCIAAWILRRKIYIHESDTVPGLANKIISKFATKVFYTFPNAKTAKNWKKHIFIWQILNPDILAGLDNLEIDENMYLNVIVIAWSQGSTRIFENLIKVLPKLSFVDFTIILWEKNTHFKKDFLKFDNVRTFDFVNQKELWQILKQTDIAITRAGATTLWELTMFWIHSLIIPLTESAWNHQMKNAEFFKENYWSEILLEWEDLSEKILYKLDKYKNLRKQGLNLKDFFNPLEEIEKEILGENYEDLEIEKEEQLAKNEEILEDEVEEKVVVSTKNLKGWWYLEKSQKKEEIKEEKTIWELTENYEKNEVEENSNTKFEQRDLKTGKILNQIDEEEPKSNFQTFSLK